ncbi:hypothetical protein DFH07DRAFT_815204 [Mycena maculata]|uniref:Uncharacterized protein n=1 Tax=Mycena maculata TaxID=230809 RepID=A0AAD7JDI2_9AGAR|nr:hypothetical protein DFH07DRAFT_815204 [Mycena maculata]
MAPLAHRATEAQIGPSAPELLNIWIYFNVVSNTVLLPILVATFLFSKRVKRHPSLVNVCITWILSGVFSLLLFYAGQQSGPEPQKALCIAQTTLLYGITPMWTVAVFIMLYNMILVLNKDSKTEVVSRPKLFLMLSAPYVTQIAFSIAALVESVAHPADVTRARRFFYCALHFSPLSMAMSLFTAIVGVGIGIQMVYLNVLLYRNWHGMRDAGMPSRIDLQLFLRVLIFGVYLIFGFVANILSMADTRSVVPDMYAATIGTVVFLSFGTQADVLRTWCFWLSDPPPERVYLPREANWRYSLDLMKSAVLPPEAFAEEREQERNIAWGKLRAEQKKVSDDEGKTHGDSIARPPAALARD